MFPDYCIAIENEVIVFWLATEHFVIINAGPSSRACIEWIYGPFYSIWSFGPVNLRTYLAVELLRDIQSLYSQENASITGRIEPRYAEGRYLHGRESQPLQECRPEQNSILMP